MKFRDQLQVLDSLAVTKSSSSNRFASSNWPSRAKIFCTISFAESYANIVSDRFVNLQRVVVLLQRCRILLLVQSQGAKFVIRISDGRLAVALFGDFQLYSAPSAAAHSPLRR